MEFKQALATENTWVVVWEWGLMKDKSKAYKWAQKTFEGD